MDGKEFLVLLLNKPNTFYFFHLKNFIELRISVSQLCYVMHTKG